MRDDVKIGILLGFLLIVGIFVYWIVHEKDGSKDGAVDTDKLVADRSRGGEPTAPQPSTTPPGEPPADQASPPPAVPIPHRPVMHDWSSGPVGGDAGYGPSGPPPVVSAVVPAVPPPSRVVETGGADRPVTDDPGASGAASPPGAANPTAPAAGSAAWSALEIGTDGTRLYRFQSGDSAWKLAQRFYGDGGKWTLIAEANQSIPNWDRVPIGATLVIPAPPPPTPGRPAPSAGAPAVVGPDEYVIQERDTLGGIAERKLGSYRLWEKIVEVNPGLNPNNLAVGKVIKLPKVDAAAMPAHGTTAAPRRTPGPGDYVVKSGESLWTIAKEQLGDGRRHDEIYQLNKDVIGPDPGRVREGMVLQLPPRQAPAAGSSGSGSGGSGATGGSSSSIDDPGETTFSSPRIL